MKTTRTNKKGKTLVATVKSYMVTPKMDIQVGKLEKKGDLPRYYENIKFNKTVSEGLKVCLRIAYKRYDGKTLVYIHSFGWTIVNDLNETFKCSKEIKNDLYSGEYENLTADEKALIQKEITKNTQKSLREIALEKLGTLTKTELMLLAYLEGKDLNETENEIKVDKSLKYKIKKHTEKYETALMKKLA